MKVDYRIYKNGENWLIIITTDYNNIIVTFDINRKKVENIKQIQTTISDYKKRLTQKYIETFLENFHTLYNSKDTVLVLDEEAPKYVFTKIVSVLDKMKKEWIEKEI